MLPDCLRCGYCCKTAACSFGEGKPCRYPAGDGPTDYECGLFDFIVEQPDAGVAPAFGAGCCCAANLDRQGLHSKAADAERATSILWPKSAPW